MKSQNSHTEDCAKLEPVLEKKLFYRELQGTTFPIMAMISRIVTRAARPAFLAARNPYVSELELKS